MGGSEIICMGTEHCWTSGQLCRHCKDGGLEYLVRIDKPGFRECTRSQKSHCVAFPLNCSISQESFDLFLTHQSPDLSGDNALGRRGEPGQLVKVPGES